MTHPGMLTVCFECNVRLTLTDVLGPREPEVVNRLVVRAALRRPEPDDVVAELVRLGVPEWLQGLEVDL